MHSQKYDTDKRIEWREILSTCFKLYHKQQYNFPSLRTKHNLHINQQTWFDYKAKHSIYHPNTSYFDSIPLVLSTAIYI